MTLFSIIGIFVVIFGVAGFAAEANRIRERDGRMIPPGPFGHKREDYSPLGWRCVWIVRLIYIAAPVLMLYWFFFTSH